jgi:excisionase family DNA binding protein
MRQWLSIDQVAEIFGVGKRTVQNYMRDGLVFYRFGATPMFDPRDIDAWIESRRVERVKV